MAEGSSFQILFPFSEMYAGKTDIEMLKGILKITRIDLMLKMGGYLQLAHRIA